MSTEVTGLECNLVGVFVPSCSSVSVSRVNDGNGNDTVGIQCGWCSCPLLLHGFNYHQFPCHEGEDIIRQSATVNKE